MKLIDEDQLSELVRNYEDYDEERRKFVVDWLRDITESKYLEILDELDPKERAFFEACTGRQTPATLRGLS